MALMAALAAGAVLSLIDLARVYVVRSNGYRVYNDGLWTGRRSTTAPNGVPSAKPRSRGITGAARLPGLLAGAAPRRSTFTTSKRSMTLLSGRSTSTTSRRSALTITRPGSPSVARSSVRVTARAAIGAARIITRRAKAVAFASGDSTLPPNRPVIMETDSIPNEEDKL